LIIADERAMRDLGARLFAACKRGAVIGLAGDLGVGKTTLVRGALESAGVRGGVRSPTYTLVELYSLPHLVVAHFDLYRLGDAEELEYLGYRDYLDGDTLCLVEWPDRAAGLLRPDLRIGIDYDPAGRRVEIGSETALGGAIVDALRHAGEKSA